MKVSVRVQFPFFALLIFHIMQRREFLYQVVKQLSPPGPRLDIVFFLPIYKTFPDNIWKINWHAHIQYIEIFWNYSYIKDYLISAFFEFEENSAASGLIHANDRQYWCGDCEDVDEMGLLCDVDYKRTHRIYPFALKNNIYTFANIQEYLEKTHPNLNICRWQQISGREKKWRI